MSVCEVDESRASNITTPPNYVSERNKYVTAEDLSTFKEDIIQLIKSLGEAQQKELKSINPTLKDIQQTNHSIESSISYLSAQNEELTKKIVQLEKKGQEDREYITLLEDKIESIQINCRKSNLELKNVPRKNTESKEELIEMILSLSTTIGGNLVQSDIKDIYRVRGKNNSPNPPIVVETTSTMVKNDILKLCKAYNTKNKLKLCAKNLGIRTREDTPIYVSEQLTAKGSRLYFRARDLARSRQYKFCWTAYGRVYVRKTETSPIIAINSEIQVDQLINKD